MWLLHFKGALADYKDHFTHHITRSTTQPVETAACVLRSSLKNNPDDVIVMSSGSSLSLGVETTNV